MFRFPVPFQVVVTIAPPWTKLEGAVEWMRQECPDVAISLLTTAEISPAHRARIIRGRVKLRNLALKWFRRNKWRRVMRRVSTLR